MKKNLYIFSFIFWWAIMFPILNFAEQELIDIKNGDIQIKSFLTEILQ